MPQGLYLDHLCSQLQKKIQLHNHVISMCIHQDCLFEKKTSLASIVEAYLKSVIMAHQAFSSLGLHFPSGLLSAFSAIGFIWKL